MLNKAVSYGMLTTSPYKVESLGVANNDDYEWWDQASDIQSFLDYAKQASRYYPAYLLALETGMRLGEIVGLSKVDINFAGGRIHVHRQWLEKKNSYGPTKHGKSRYIDFDPNGPLATVLKRAVFVSPHPEAIFVTANDKRVRNRKLAAVHFQILVSRSLPPGLVFMVCGTPLPVGT